MFLQSTSSGVRGSQGWQTGRVPFGLPAMLQYFISEPVSPVSLCKRAGPLKAACSVGLKNFFYSTSRVLPAAVTQPPLPGRVCSLAVPLRFFASLPTQMLFDPAAHGGDQ